MEPKHGRRPDEQRHTVDERSAMCLGGASEGEDIRGRPRPGWSALCEASHPFRVQPAVAIVGLRGLVLVALGRAGVGVEGAMPARRGRETARGSNSSRQQRLGSLPRGISLLASCSSFGGQGVRCVEKQSALNFDENLITFGPTTQLPQKRCIMLFCMLILPYHTLAGLGRRLRTKYFKPKRKVTNVS